MRAGSIRQRFVAGSHSSALSWRRPPLTSTRPSASRVAAIMGRGSASVPACVTVPRAGSTSSANGPTLSAVTPPTTRMRPSASPTARWSMRPLASSPMRVSRRVPGSKRSTAADSVLWPRLPPMTTTLPSAAVAAAWCETASVPTGVARSGSEPSPSSLPTPPQAARPPSEGASAPREIEERSSVRRCMGRCRAGRCTAVAADRGPKGTRRGPGLKRDCRGRQGGPAM